MKARDENDKLRDGDLPHDPFEGTVHVPPPGDPFEGRWQPLSETLLRTKPPPRRWLLTRAPAEGFDGRGEAGHVGLLPLGKVGMLAAAGGVGKTMALCQLALAVATGKEWLGLKTPNPGRVLIALGEEDLDEVHRRLFHASAAMQLQGADFKTAAERIIALPLAGVSVALTRGDGQGNVTEAAVLTQMKKRLEQGGPWSLLVLDPLSRFAGPDVEKDNAAATRFVQAIETLVDAPGGPTVLVAHHTNKVSRSATENDASAARGASGLVDGVRWVANLDTDGKEVCVLRFTKSNYSAPAPDLYLRRQPEHGGALRPMSRAEVEAHREGKDAKKKPGASPERPRLPSFEDVA
jgi:RecA-family ATPase